MNRKPGGDRQDQIVDVGRRTATTSFICKGVGLALIACHIGSCSEPEDVQPSAETMDNFIDEMEANAQAAHASAVAESRAKEERQREAAERRLKASE
jgi:ABC-type sulfate transport system substrate-binding protein